MTTPAADRQGIQSVEIGFSLLHELSRANRSMMLRDIARGAAMPPAKAHRYMVSFLRLGLVEQDRATGRYDLGPRALELGLASIARIDPVTQAGPLLEDLCDTIQGTVALAVWGSHGPTIVRILDAGGPVSVTLRHGAVLSLYKSATGRAFSTFFRSPFLRDALEQELTEEARSQGIAVGTIRRQFENMLREFGGHGIARTTGSLTPGINGLSVPVFDHGGRMVAAITALGSVGDFDVEWDSPTTKAMKETGYALSRRMGYGLAADSSGASSSGAPGRNRTNT